MSSKPALNDAQVHEVTRLFVAADQPISDIAEAYEVSQNTIYRAIRRKVGYKRIPRTRGNNAAEQKALDAHYAKLENERTSKLKKERYEAFASAQVNRVRTAFFCSSSHTGYNLEASAKTAAVPVEEARLMVEGRAPYSYPMLSHTWSTETRNACYDFLAEKRDATIAARLVPGRAGEVVEVEVEVPVEIPAPTPPKRDLTRLRALLHAAQVTSDIPEASSRLLELAIKEAAE